MLLQHRHEFLCLVRVCLDECNLVVQDTETIDSILVEASDSAVDLLVELEAKLQKDCRPTRSPHEGVWPRTLCDLVLAGHG